MTDEPILSTREPEQPQKSKDRPGQDGLKVFHEDQDVPKCPLLLACDNVTLWEKEKHSKPSSNSTLPYRENFW